MTRPPTECLRQAIRIETLAMELYGALAEAAVHHPWLRELFLRLAEEERQHAMRIRLLEKHERPAPWAPATTRRIVEDLEAMSVEILRLKRELGSEAIARDAGELLRRLAEMEVRFASVHAEELATTADPEVQKLFASLARQDEKHQDLIRKAIRKVAA